MPLQVVDHPLAKHLLSRLRDKATPPAAFRDLCRNLTTMLVLEATRNVATAEHDIETPVKTTKGRLLSQGLAAVPVLRAGLGMLESVVQLFPDVAVGYVGLERHETTAVARSYYSKLPPLADRFAICLDPMLATGGSAAQAVDVIKAHGAQSIAMVCIVAAPEGVAKFEEAHPTVPIYTASLDEGLNERFFIVPGLGDFGDRLYGTA